MLKKIITTGTVFLCLVGGFALLFWYFLPHLAGNQTNAQPKQEKLTYVAIGDSLTQGVGDTDNAGGFVTLLKADYEKAYNTKVTTSNFGVSGNTSQQILQRMQSQGKIQTALKKADVMTLTVGGNDVLHVIRRHLSDLKVSTFEQPAKEYQERLRQIIEAARKDNSDLPIYVLGIYNPFYLNFPEMTAMQDVIDNWNAATESVTKDYTGVYFVPINDLLYKGIDGKGGVTQESDGTQTITNNALYDGDHFHPNHTGYQIMANAVMEKINDTRKDW